MSRSPNPNPLQQLANAAATRKPSPPRAPVDTPLADAAAVLANAIGALCIAAGLIVLLIALFEAHRHIDQLEGLSPTAYSESRQLIWTTTGIAVGAAMGSITSGAGLMLLAGIYRQVKGRG
jgi:hypothetical protein